jgi:hypothetical protein
MPRDMEAAVERDGDAAPIAAFAVSKGRGRHQAHLPQRAPAGVDQAQRRRGGRGGPAGDGGAAPRLPRPRRPALRQPLPPRAPGPAQAAPYHRHRPLIR